jgi:hypothetical protein
VIARRSTKDKRLWRRKRSAKSLDRIREEGWNDMKMGTRMSCTTRKWGTKEQENRDNGMGSRGIQRIFPLAASVFFVREYVQKYWRS